VPADTGALETPPVQLQDDPLADAMAVPDAPDLPESLLLGGIRMVRDSRGVRIETVPEEAD
jgi:cyanophycin synthetase